MKSNDPRYSLICKNTLFLAYKLYLTIRSLEKCKFLIDDPKISFNLITYTLDNNAPCETEVSKSTKIPYKCQIIKTAVDYKVQLISENECLIVTY